MMVKNKTSNQFIKYDSPPYINTLFEDSREKMYPNQILGFITNTDQSNPTKCIDLESDSTVFISITQNVFKGFVLVLQLSFSLVYYNHKPVLMLALPYNLFFTNCADKQPASVTIISCKLCTSSAASLSLTLQVQVTQSSSLSVQLLPLATRLFWPSITQSAWNTGVPSQ